MLNLVNTKRFTVVGGGTAGWFAAITLRRILHPSIEVMVIASSELDIIGVGEGGITNLPDALSRNHIDLELFREKTGGLYKLGFAYEGWRTGEDSDAFFHLFQQSLPDGFLMRRLHHFYPYASALINRKIPLEHGFRGFADIIMKNATQEEAKRFYNQGQCDLAQSFHFDSYKTAHFLKEIAISRGVIYKDVKVISAKRNDAGHVQTINTASEEISTDFVIDATGLRRFFIQHIDTEWDSFKPYLAMDRAIPFYMKHPFKNPALYTRAIAMQAGWMWQIPLQERVGAGYVFSSLHLNEEEAQQEVLDKLGETVEFKKMIRFEPGCYKKVWVGNVMALGLSSGFVEPLEATSIGQMLSQLKIFEDVLVNSSGVVGQATLDSFNQVNYHSWLSVRDFLCLHYDCPRRDNDFWQDVAQLPRPESYLQLKECMQHRTVRTTDMLPYAPKGWPMLFGEMSWTMVASGLGLINPDSTFNELRSLPLDAQQSADAFSQQFMMHQGPLRLPDFNNLPTWN